MKRGRGKRGFLLALCLICAIVFAGLGVWQVERRAWKLDLIERVEARRAAAPAALPPARDWPALDPAEIEYRKVRLAGAFLHDRETLVDALTERGPGYWVVTPLQTSEGVVLVNRGFVPPERKLPASRTEAQVSGETSVTGLLRVTEPGGRFLRSNAPDEDLWYSRDVAAIAAKRGLADPAPFFVDADATPNPGGVPVGGLTVIQFRNHHLVYALTWFALAGLSLAGLAILLFPSLRRTGWTRRSSL